MVKVCDNDICICHRVGSDLSKDGAAAETELELRADRDECLPCGHPSPAASSLLTLSPPARPGSSSRHFSNPHLSDPCLLLTPPAAKELKAMLGTATTTTKY